MSFRRDMREASVVRSPLPRARRVKPANYISGVASLHAFKVLNAWRHNWITALPNSGVGLIIQPAKSVRFRRALPSGYSFREEIGK
jgi:hypothetical protein